MTALRWLWNPGHYWPLWLVGLVSTFALREFWALASGRPGDTLSVWVWRHLKIRAGEGIGDWTFVDFAFFALYCSLWIWLAGHFFWHKWAGR